MQLPRGARVTPRAETKIQREILEFLGCVPGRFTRMNSRVVMMPGRGGRQRPVRFGEKGMADIIGVLKPSGRYVAIEVKRPGQHPTPEQEAFLREVGECNGIAIVARSVQDVAWLATAEQRDRPGR
jgi:hypothetical protein